MVIKSNGYYNDPAFAQAAASLAAAFAPPSGGDAAGWANAKATKEKAAALAESFRGIRDATDNAGRDRFGTAATVYGGGYSPNQSFYSVDAANATSRANNAADNAARLDLGMIAPVGAGQTRFVPQSIADRYKVDPVQVGVIEADAGKEYFIPGQVDPIQGPEKPLSKDEVLARVLQRMPENQQQAVAFGSTPLDPVVGADGVITSLLRPDAIGKTPAPDAGKVAKPTNGTYLLPNGRKGAAVQAPGETFWRDAQTGDKLPADAQVFDMPKPEGTAEQVGLSKPAQSEIDKSLIDISVAKDTALRLRDLVANSPASQGVVGWMRGTAQDLMQVGGEVSNFFGGRIAEIDKAIEAGTADAGIKSSFDPNIPAIEMLANLLAFQYAKTTTGERLSNEMLQASRRALGLEGLASNQASAITRINEAIGAIDRQGAILQAARQRGLSGLNQPVQPSPAPSSQAPGGNRSMPTAQQLSEGDIIKGVSDAAGTPAEQEQRFEQNVIQKWGRDANGKPVRLQ